MKILDNTYILRMPAGNNMLIDGEPAYAAWLASLIRDECRCCDIVQVMVPEGKLRPPTIYDMISRQQ